MRITSLKLSNWKCFSEELSINFSNIEIFSFPNGSGKTSVLEAIYYGLWGKTDNKLSSYQNHEGETSVVVQFELDGIAYTISREMAAGKAVMKKEDSDFKKGIKEVYEYMNSIIPYNLVKRLWFKGDVAESPVLDFNFFKNEILAEQLADPTALYNYYASLSRQKSREINSINNVRTDLRSIEDIDKDIEDIYSKLKGKKRGNDFMYMKAVATKNAVEDLNKLKEGYSQSGVAPISFNDVRAWKNLNIEDLKRKLSVEESKLVDETLKSLDENVLHSVYKANNINGRCVICGHEWNEDRKEYLKEILETGFKSDFIIKDLNRKIAFKESFTDDFVKSCERYYELENKASQMSNYQDIIDSYNKESDSLWQKLDSLNSEKNTVLLNEQELNRLKKLEKEKSEAKDKAAFIKKYLDNATTFYTKSLLDKANEILTDINGDYNNITISPESNAIEVSVKGDNLLISQMSRGEKTMVALSLIYAIRDIFTPSMPLIFDESFASLSEENNNGVIEIVKESQEQLFIITHNKAWVEYEGYGSSVNVRTQW